MTDTLHTDKKSPQICIVGGGGFVGIVTGVGFALLGSNVVCADIDQARIDQLSSGELPISEPHLKELLDQAKAARRISFTTDVAAAVSAAETIIVAVGTPTTEGTTPDLRQLTSAMSLVAERAKKDALIVIKSTLPINMNGPHNTAIGDLIDTHQRHVVINPEFLCEGSGFADFFLSKKIVIGANSDQAKKMARKLYSPLLDAKSFPAVIKPPLNFRPEYIETDYTSAQLAKYASNAYLATRLSFFNEIAGLAERIGGDTQSILKALSTDPRIGNFYMKVGAGFGGPCLEKDIQATISVAKQINYRPAVLEAVLERNNLRLDEVKNDILRLTEAAPGELRVCLWGLAFKPNTDDLRSSLSIRLIERLRDSGVSNFSAHDPLIASSQAGRLPKGCELHADMYQAAAGAHILVIMNDSEIYYRADLAKLAAANPNLLIYDTRYIISRAAATAHGLKYATIGTQT